MSTTPAPRALLKTVRKRKAKLPQVLETDIIEISSDEDDEL
jgi:hypothetical protein